MLLDAQLALVADGRAAPARWDADPELPCDREGAQKLHVIGQVAEALAEENRRGEGTEGLRADALRAGAAEVGIDPDGRDGLARLIPVELVFETDSQIVPPALGISTIGLELLVHGAEPHAEVLGDSLRHVHREIRLAR